jgi:peptidyl-dipeptidase Dcp
MRNPLLLSAFNTSFNTIPFEEIKLEHYMPAMKKGIELGKAEINAIKKNLLPANFENTFETLERCGKLLDTASSVFFNLNSSETSEEMQQLAQELSPMLTAYSNDILMDEELFIRIKEAYENSSEDNLNTEQKMLREKTFKSFVRNGANLKGEDKETLKKLNTELSKLSLTFGENLLKASNAFEMWIDKEDDLVGLPDGFKEACVMAAKAKGKENNWLITLEYPSFIPFMKYSEKRELRKKLYLAFGSRSFQKDENNNESNVREISKLRHQKANLLGYASHANLILEERMAEKPGKVYQLLDELLEHALPVAKKEMKEIQELSNRLNGPSPIERWDFSYYSEKLKNEKFAINDEILKPYFQLEKVIDGAFITAKKLYGITFEKLDNIQKYHEDVITYAVKDKYGKHLSVFYADFFPRPGKRDGAWMTSFSGQNKYDGIDTRPLVSIVCNFTKPTDTKPSLLTFGEVTTLFHEFGHALHGMMANGHYESLSGTSVYWDFVELPSQLMENWCYEKECLDLFARHYETDEIIPIDLVQKIKDSANFLSGYQTVRQVGLGRLDMSWHNLTSIPTNSVYEFEENAIKGTELFPPAKETTTSCAFSHIFQGGYSAGYYSYKWAEVLEADTFELFKETGIYNKETATNFLENILSKGGSEHPMELYKKFRGKEPSTKALLIKTGLIEG